MCERCDIGVQIPIDCTCNAASDQPPSPPPPKTANVRPGANQAPSRARQQGSSWTAQTAPQRRRSSSMTYRITLIDSDGIRIDLDGVLQPDGGLTCKPPPGEYVSVVLPGGRRIRLTEEMVVADGQHAAVTPPESPTCATM